jgi:hypothetical protein
MSGSNFKVQGSKYLCWLAPLLLVVTCSLPAALAQDEPPPPPPKPKEIEHNPPALQYGVAIVSTLAVLSILCYPSRKRSKIYLD